jgi:hypothetical protein
MTKTPTITVTYHPSGVADVLAVWESHRASARGKWATGGPVWLAGIYDRSHRVGLHGGRLAVVQQGVTPLRVVDAIAHRGDLRLATQASRSGWRGWNLHDARGDLAGCIGLTGAAMLDVLGVLERARAAGAEQHDEGGVLVTVRVEHRP